jgi:hypothetical protein
LLRLPTIGNMPRNIYTVKWDEEQAAWNILPPVHIFEIIGNIYEHPHLLTNEK